MSKKNKNNQGQPSVISTATHREVITDEKPSFKKSDRVKVRGTEDKRFSMSPKETYIVTGEMAEILIAKGAAVLVEENDTKETEK